MNAIDLLREQFKSAHHLLEETMKDVSDDTAHFADTKKALPVGAGYAHAVVSEDVLLAMMMLQSTPLAADNSMTGLSEPMPSMAEWDKHEKWAQTVKVDLAKFREYAQKVYKQTDDYLATLKEEDLEVEMDMSSMGMGKQTRAFVLTNIFLLHIANLTGEISAAKGFQGQKGYPF